MNLAVGFFDGVHLGHRRILERADAALTFREHPLSVLAPDKAPALLMTLEERMAAIASALCKPLRQVKALPFTRELAAEKPDVFAARLHRDYPDLETVLCGPNWRFGAGGLGDAGFLRSRGFSVEEVPFEELGGEPVSSTRIRAALSAGDIELANAMLGRRFSVCGEVASGKGEGRRMGFPTINLRPSNRDTARLLPFGAYAVDTDLGRGVANWGRAPTMGGRAWAEPVFEVHVISPARGLAPSDVPSPFKFTLVRHLRPEMRFASCDALREQIAADVFSASHCPSNVL